MNALAFPDRAVPKRASRRARERAGEALASAERDVQLLHVELEVAIERMQAHQPEIALWVTTAVWLLELAIQDLIAEPDAKRRREGAVVALHHVMRVSAGLEIATMLGVLSGEPERFDARLGAVLAHLERARVA